MPSQRMLRERMVASRDHVDGDCEKSVDNTHKMLVPTQAGNPGCAAGGGTTMRLPGIWGGSLTNLLLTGVMPQPHGSPTFSQLDSDSRLAADIVDGEKSGAGWDGGTSGRDEMIGPEMTTTHS